MNRRKFLKASVAGLSATAAVALGTKNGRTVEKVEVPAKSRIGIPKAVLSCEYTSGREIDEKGHMILRKRVWARIKSNDEVSGLGDVVEWMWDLCLPPKDNHWMYVGKSYTVSPFYDNAVVSWSELTYEATYLELELSTRKV